MEHKRIEFLDKLGKTAAKLEEEMINLREIKYFITKDKVCEIFVRYNLVKDTAYFMLMKGKIDFKLSSVQLLNITKIYTKSVITLKYFKDLENLWLGNLK